MKKSFINFILIMLMASLLLSLAACGTAASAEEAPEPAAPEATDTKAESPEEAAADAATAEEIPPADSEYPRYSTAWIEELRATLPPLPDVDIHSWEFILANYYNSITQYSPEEYMGFEGQVLDARVVDAAAAFLDAIKDQGYHIYVATAHRNTEYLINHFKSRCLDAGNAYDAVKLLLPLGCNEHQTGLAIDLTTHADRSGYFAEFSNEDFLETDAYKWALEHCSEYGFINRYPEGKEEFYGVPCHCAGHFRYVGVEAAKYITENNLCLEEFISLYDPSLVYIPSKISD